MIGELRGSVGAIERTVLRLVAKKAKQARTGKNPTKPKAQRRGKRPRP